MKKILPICLIAIIGLTSCKSNEDKALALIDREMFKTLFDYDSYEPIETIVKEGSSSIYTDSLIRAYAINVMAVRDLSQEASEKADRALEYAHIYSGGYSYSSQRKFNDYISQVKQENEKLKFYLDRWKLYEDSIKLQVANFQPQPIGWEVAHKFRCKSKGGNSMIANYVYIIDSKFTKIISQFDMDDENETSIRKRIDLAIKEN